MSDGDRRAEADKGEWGWGLERRVQTIDDIVDLARRGPLNELGDDGDALRIRELFVAF